MSVSRNRTLLVTALVVCPVALVAAFWSAGAGSSVSPRSLGRPLPHSMRASAAHDDVGVVTSLFSSADDAHAYFTRAADQVGRKDPRLVTAICPLGVPGALEYVLRHGPDERETILLVPNGNRVHRITLLHSPAMPGRQVQASIIAAARGLLTD
jgi:hypothetical protein